MATACLALGLSVLPGVALAAPKTPRGETETVVYDPVPPHATIKARGTNGYRIEVSIYDENAILMAQKEDPSEGAVAYNVLRGSVVKGRVRASFGRVAKISARFVPSGKTSHFKEPGCKGGPELRRQGSFVGTISIVGEEGFTRFTGRRAPGEIASSPRQVCRIPKTHFSPPPPEPSARHFFTEFFLSGGRRGVETYFTATRRELEPKVARFGASSSERRGQMSITRSVAAEAPGAAFSFDDALDSATIAPPAPFAGSATFTRIDDFASRWEGTLTVSFPGRANVPLTGRAYSWNLEREVDADHAIEGANQAG